MFLVLLYVLYFVGPVYSLVALAAGVVAAVTAIALSKSSGSERAEGLCVYLIPIAIALILCASVPLFTFKQDSIRSERYIGAEGRYELIVEQVKYESDFYCLYVGRVEEIDERLVIISYEDRLEMGQRVTASLSISALNDSDTGYSERDAYRSQGIYLKAVCREALVISEGNYDIKMRFRLINDRYCERIASMTDEDTSAIITALFLGNKKELSSSDGRDFARLGISHILALSGMHLSIIASVTNGILDVLGTGKRKKYLLTVAVIALFVALTGFSKSVMRAGVMLLILYTLFFFKFRADFVTEIFLSVTLICIFSPYSVMSVSLILSFLAVLGCVISTFAMPRRRMNKAVRWLLSGIVTTLSVTLITLPIIFMNFGFVSVIAPVSNLIFMPLFNVLLVASPLLLLFGGVPILGDGIIWACERLTAFILYLSGSMASLDNIAYPIYTTVHAIGVALVALAIVLIISLDKKRLRLGIIVLAVGILAATAQTAVTGIDRAYNTYVTPYGDRSGDRIYLESGGEICVIDSIPISKSSLSQVNYTVTDMGYLDIGAYIVTDYSSRLYSALDMLTDITYVRRVVLPPPITEDELIMFKETVSMLTEKGTEVECGYIGVRFEGVTVHFAPPDKLPRSQKRLVAYSIEGETSRFTYVGASVFESRLANEFVLKYIKASDAVYFGTYGPRLKYSFRYDLTGVHYCMFATGTLYYANCETEGVRTVLEGTRFVLR